MAAPSSFIILTFLLVVQLKRQESRTCFVFRAVFFFVVRGQSHSYFSTKVAEPNPEGRDLDLKHNRTIQQSLRIFPSSIRRKVVGNAPKRQVAPYVLH
jgi:hypothetical protein